MSAAAFDALNAAIGARTIPLQVEELPFDQIVEAHRRIDRGHVQGKIVLRIR
jgi:enoyl reductase